MGLFGSDDKIIQPNLGRVDDRFNQMASANQSYFAKLLYEALAQSAGSFDSGIRSGRQENVGYNRLIDPLAQYRKIAMGYEDPIAIQGGKPGFLGTLLNFGSKAFQGIGGGGSFLSNMFGGGGGGMQGPRDAGYGLSSLQK